MFDLNSPLFIILTNIVTNFVQYLIGKHSRRIKTVICCYVSENALNDIDASNNQQIIAKVFKIYNTTGEDLTKIHIIFRFEVQAQIVGGEIKTRRNSYSIMSQAEKPKSNEYVVKLDNFTRKHACTCKFYLTGLVDHNFEIVEDKVKGIRIKTKDKRKDNKISIMKCNKKELD